ncbi:hypothetical protein M758_UG050600 [Ceratodon purpureus]|nr:hypothetical protein M758_UG050600 [Ceratodon purpureus]
MRTNDMPIPVSVPKEEWRLERSMKLHPGEPILVEDMSFFDRIPRDVVITYLWPKLMSGYSMESCLKSWYPELMMGVSRVENFQVCYCLRTVCSGGSHSLKKPWSGS